MHKTHVERWYTLCVQLITVLDMIFFKLIFCKVKYETTSFTRYLMLANRSAIIFILSNKIAKNCK